MSAATEASGSAPQSPERLGLALSGGGFRASFFHLGVLARLAELGALRSVDVISTVSGGSILGAAYYLHLRNLLTTKPESEIEHEDYVKIIQTLETEMLAAVGKNVRGRVLLNPLKNLWMARRRYSRSDRIGDLYDRYIYKPIWRRANPPRERKWWGAERQIEMRELRIQPAGEATPFDPRTGNARRRARVPILLLNATTLNTGHNWRFEAVRMGEPPAKDVATEAIVADVDANVRLGQGYFDPEPGKVQVAPEQQDFPLALAVAASACVPTLFHPLAIGKMYDGYQVELVDGGVHDNQGVQGLIDEACSHLIISDASGQMLDVKKPSSRVPGVASRSMNIYGDRIREEQLVRVEERGTSYALMHLRKGIVPGVIQPGAEARTTDQAQAEGVHSAAFGVAEECQEALARFRTDLDACSDFEAYALMLDGYLMTRHVMDASPGFESFPPPEGPFEPEGGGWRFKALGDRLAAPPSGLDKRRFQAASKRFLKPLGLVPFGHAGLLILALAGLGLLIFWDREAIWDGFHDSWTVWPVTAVVGGLLVFAAAYLATEVRFPLVRVPADFVAGTLAPLAVALPGVLASAAMILVGRLHRRLGRVG